ncbi:MFS transporter [Methylobacterium sp. C25]|uniref:MFS transporter n=1 Tax=Methylobacterium sp. C25 TaxID=2721622 RepID=UPI001F18EF5E|nr:MFS transporter [Methylobacterium sp. C25]MCE4225444.1 MFS transporter [Methylobacterium sp. C25]
MDGDRTNHPAAGGQPSPLGIVIAPTGFAFLLVQLDVSIVNVALAAMGSGLGASVDGLQWIVDAYTLAFAALLLFAGTLGDRVGARKVFLSGFGLFIASSAACGLSTSLTSLVSARVMQGAGAALMVPSSLALLNHACAEDAAARSRAVGLWTAAGSIGLATGPMLGGLLVDAFGWRSVFLVNVPIGILGIATTLFFVREAGRRAGRFDAAGQLLGIVSLVAIVGAAIEAGPRGWLSPIPIAALATALSAAGAFVWVERCSRDPMLPLGFFRDPSFSAATFVGLCVNLTLYGILFVLSLYLQHERGYSPAEAGRAFLPFTVVLGLANVFAGRASGRIAARTLMIGGLSMAVVSYVALAFLGAARVPIVLQGCLIGLSFGIGITVPTMTSSLLSRVPPQRGGVASGVLNTVRQAGGALGVALFGTMLAADAQAGLRVALLVSASLLAAAAVAVWLAGRAEASAQ